MCREVEMDLIAEVVKTFGSRISGSCEEEVLTTSATSKYRLPYAWQSIRDLGEEVG